LTLSQGSTGPRRGSITQPARIKNPPPPSEGCVPREGLSHSQLCYGGDLVNLENFRDHPDDIRALHAHFFYGIPEPPKEKRIFAPATKDTILEVVLIELKSKVVIEGLIPAIFNIGHIYGGTNVALTVIHHDFHEQFLTPLKAGWSGVRWIKMDGYFTIPDYNKMLTSFGFWDQFSSKFILITHTDSMIYRPLDEDMFEYEYVGAPWPFAHSVCNPPRPNVGNGGYSLRNVSFHKKIISTDVYDEDLPEDVWWCRRTQYLPDWKKAMRFSVEDVWYDGVPTGSHQLHLMSPFFKSGNYWRTLIKNNYPEGQACLELQC